MDTLDFLDKKLLDQDSDSVSLSESSDEDDDDEDSWGADDDDNDGGGEEEEEVVVSLRHYSIYPAPCFVLTHTYTYTLRRMMRLLLRSLVKLKVPLIS